MGSIKIGKIIKELRKVKGYNQTEFAIKCGITQTTLSQIETGSKRPHESTLKNICDKLEITESLLHILSIDENDVPSKKKELFKQMFPSIKSLMIKILTEDDNDSLH